MMMTVMSMGIRRGGVLIAAGVMAAGFVIAPSTPLTGNTSQAQAASAGQLEAFNWKGKGVN